MKKTKNPYIHCLSRAFVWVLLGIFASCSDSGTEILENEEEGTVAISFGKIKTRAEVTEASDIKNFSVFGERTHAQGTTNVFNNERVYRNGSGNLDYDNTRYWAQSSLYDFFAVHPYMQNGISKTDFTVGENTYPGYQVSFTTPVGADTDLMTAYVGVDTSDGYPASVNFEFGHKLSMVSFAVSKENANDLFIVNQVTLVGVKSQGTYRTSSNGGYTDNWECTSATMQVTRTSLNATIDGAEKRVLGENKGFMLIPQTVGNVTLRINYTYKQAGADEYQTKSIEAQLPTTKINKWVSSERYLYKLTLSVDNHIYFSTPTVESWGTMQSGGTIIIK